MVLSRLIFEILTT